MIPANYLRAKMHKPPNPITQFTVMIAQLTAERDEYKKENDRLKREMAVMTAMQDLIDAKVAKSLKGHA